MNSNRFFIGIILCQICVLIVVPQLPAAEETQISGFVDASYYGDLNTQANSFGLDQVEVDVEKTFGSNGILRTDIEWVNDGLGGFTPDAEQGYLTWIPAFVPQLSLTLGKFNAPIGFELLDAPDMYQYSHALVFEYGLPTNLTGVMVGIDIGSGVDAVLYAVNGWDQNNEMNKIKTGGGRIGYSLGELGGIGLSAIMGADDIDQDNLRSVYDLDLTFTPMEQLILGGEWNMGSITQSLGSTENTINWSGFLVMAHYDFNSWLGMTLRIDSFADSDNYVFGGVDDNGDPLNQNRMAITFAPTFVLGENMGALIEFRNDLSDAEVFVDSEGEGTKSTSAIAFEMTYTF